MPAIQGNDSSSCQFQVAEDGGTPATLGLRRNFSIDIAQTPIETSSAADHWSTFIPGQSVFTLEGEYVYDKSDAPQDALRVAALGTTSSGVIDFIAKIDTETFTGSGTLTSWSPTVPYDDAVSVTFSIQGSGAIVHAT